MTNPLWRRLRDTYRLAKRSGRHGVKRVRRFERKEVRQFMTWIEDTRNLIHVSILLFVPLLIGAVTILSNSIGQLSFLLFPPLASGTYTLFADPSGKFASPGRFVAGLTIGALCGWAALELGLVIYDVPVGALQIDAAGTALSVVLTGVVTWALDIEEPAAFSTALLVLVTKTSQLAYVVSIAGSSALVGAVFIVWKRRFYEQRSRYLYRSTTDEDRVLVPMRDAHKRSTALLAGRLAGGDTPGEVVLVDVVDDAALARRERDLFEQTHDDATLEPDSVDTGAASAAMSGTMTPGKVAEQRACERAVTRLEEEAEEITSTLDIPCEVVVAAGTDPAGTVLDIAEDTGCDLIVTTYEEEEGMLTPFVNELFNSDIDIVVHRAVEGRSSWDRVLTPVRRGGDLANRMVDFAIRLAPTSGRVSVCHCIDNESERNSAEKMLNYLIEPFAASVETRVYRSAVEDFLAESAPQYDLIMLGASSDRSVVSRFVVPPTFERVKDVDCDIALVHRG